MTLCERFLRQVETIPDAVAVDASGDQATYADLAMRAKAIASWLRGQRLERGERVALLLKNSVDYVACYLGIQLAGGIVVALNPECSADELDYTLADCTPKCVVVNDLSAKTLGRVTNQSMKAVTTTKPWLLFTTVVCGTRNSTEPELPADESVVELSEVLSAGAQGNGREPQLPQRHELAQIIYTSGTTGHPKGVTLSHQNIESNCSSILQYLNLTRNDSVLVTLPFFYSYGNSLLFTHLASGGRLVLTPDFVFWNRVLDLLQQAKVTGFSGVPSSFAMLLHRSDFRKRDFPDLRYLTCAGGALAPAVVDRLRKVVPHAQLFLMYGQTEATARLSTLLPQDLDLKLGSIGRGIPGVTLQVLDTDGKPVPPGEVGEIVANGENVMTGYWRDRDATKSVLRQTGLHTGDLARVDEDGYIYIVGRNSDMIKSGAYRINPKEIEEIVLQHPDVAEVAVVGMPDEIFSEVPVAFVVAANASHPPTESQIIAHCRGHLPRYKLIRNVRVVDALPKTASGKVKRVILRQHFMADSSCQEVCNTMIEVAPE